MTAGTEEMDSAADNEPPVTTRTYRVAVSVVLLVPLTVFLGYGGWLFLSIMAVLFGYEPRTATGERLRDRLVAWPDRNREVMRTDGHVPLPWRP